jgi:intracellular multiplication protein IcmE
MSNDFDNDLNDFDNDDFDDFKSQNSLKDIWQNNPIVKILTVIVGIVILLGVYVAFSGDEEDSISRVGNTPDQREAPGGEVSQAYADAITSVNENRTEAALSDPNRSAIPIPFNLQEQELLSESDEGPQFGDFDPLAGWRQQAVPEEIGEPVVLEEEPVLAPFEGPIGPQPVPGPSPDVVAALAQAMSQQMGEIIGGQAINSARVMGVTPKDFLNQDAMMADGVQTQLVDTDGDGVPDTALTSDPIIDDVVIETILIPAGTINYGQMLIEANSDVPGPVLVQLVSGPLAGARLIGSFQVQNEYLVLQFNTIVIDGKNSSINAIAIDPATTLPGVATEVNNRYFTRILLPAAGEFIEGIGRGFAQDAETTIVTGDVVTTTQSNLDFEQEIGVGVESAAREINEFMDERADEIERLVRVARGTPIGIFFTQPVLEQ